MQLRPYQAKIKSDINEAWRAGANNVLAVLPTGAGKTVVFSDVILDHNGASCAIAHRQELVVQISTALAKDNVRHKIVGQHHVIRQAIKQHIIETGNSFFDPNSQCAVASVDTLVRGKDKLKSWANNVTLWVQDEAHHLLEGNKWGNASTMFPRAKGLGVTATPVRADGKGLGRHADGIIDVMVEGPTMRELIDAGYLTDYRVFAPPNDLNLNNIPVSAGGDFSPKPLDEAIQNSQVIGDVVTHYKRIANGKLGITFATTVDTALEIAKRYNNARVPAAVVSAKTKDIDRVKILSDFKARKILQLVNVDLFGEGFDLPAIEVVSMARPTKSFALFCQQFGRALRLLDGKTKAIIIDHVSNVMYHRLPDAVQNWTLDARESRGKRSISDAVPLRVCPECTSPYERTHKVCPYCGYYPTPVSRSEATYVDGDLTELDPKVLADMRSEIERIDGPFYARGDMNRPARMSAAKHHSSRQTMQNALRGSIAWWAGWQRDMGRSDFESYRRFYFTFGVDVMTAQTLNKKDAKALAQNINTHIGRS